MPLLKGFDYEKPFERNRFWFGIAYRICDIIFTNNILNNNALVGIDVNFNGGINNVTITGNTVNNNGDAGISVLAGAGTPSTSTMLVSNNQVSMQANQRFGIEFKKCCRQWFAYWCRKCRNFR